MGRSTPFLSPISILIAALVFFTVGLTLWINGPQAFSPGPVSAQTIPGVSLQGFSSHADFERECSRCHRPFSGRQAILCLDCHTAVANDQSGGTGFHGRLDPAQACFDCHPEHEGREFNLVNLDVCAFDHTLTNFPLQGKHNTVECGDCHPGDEYRLGVWTCGQCHAEPEIHTGMFDPECESCHSAEGWEFVLVEGQPFNHDLVGFTLEEHAEDFSGNPIPCRTCHQGGAVADPSEVCINCHGAEEAEFVAGHRMQFGDDCLACHDGTDDLVNFDHALVFPLEGEHATLDCVECHQQGIFAGTPAECQSCHEEPAAHRDLFGISCVECHTSTGWKPALLDGSPFNHERLNFRLEEHDEDFDDHPIACTDCHFGPVEATGSEACIQCHGGDDPEFISEHRQEFGSDCLECHDGTDE